MEKTWVKASGIKSGFKWIHTLLSSSCVTLRRGSGKPADFTGASVFLEGGKSLLEPKGKKTVSSVLKVSIFRIIFFYPRFSLTAVIGVSKCVFSTILFPQWRCTDHGPARAPGQQGRVERRWGCRWCGSVRASLRTCLFISKTGRDNPYPAVGSQEAVLRVSPRVSAYRLEPLSLCFLISKMGVIGVHFAELPEW